MPRPLSVVAHLTPAVLSWWLLAAHFLRWGQIPLVAVCLVAPLLFLVRAGWVRVVSQVAMVLGASLWGLAAMRTASRRQIAQQPWLRMALILGGVAAFNLLAAWLLQRKGMRLWFRGAPPAPADET